MQRTVSGRLSRALALAGVVAAAMAVAASVAAAPSAHGNGADKLDKVQHVVVIYEENHSFDNLYGGWEGVNGLANADAAHTTQIGQAGAPYTCLLQNDVNLASPPLTPTCADTTTPTPFVSHFANNPFTIDDYIASSDTTCPAPGVFAPNGIPKGSGLPGGCTRDLVHRFYQEQYQLNGGAQNRYTTGSDAVGLTQGIYRTQSLPIYKYLHAEDHPKYAIADDFFQAAFGGSFLNHQWLVAAATPTYPGAPTALHSVLDANAMPNNYLLYHATGPVSDKAVTAYCSPAVVNRLCGDYAINTIQPFQQPANSGSAQLPALSGKTIGDELTDADVSWGWYAGGWSNADGDVGAPGWTNGAGVCSDPNSRPNPAWPYCPHKLFQFHHQPFNYYTSFARGTTQRSHLRDEVQFQDQVSASAKSCALDSVSFVKPLGSENEHPGYTSESGGSDHLVSLIDSIEKSACAKDTMIVVTYDEFGGSWDHVPPPGQGNTNGPHDLSGPGTRIPALIVSPLVHGRFAVDHTQHDTTSILATIEHRYGLAPLGTRDAQVADLSSVFQAKPVGDDSDGASRGDSAG